MQTAVAITMFFIRAIHSRKNNRYSLAHRQKRCRSPSVAFGTSRPSLRCSAEGRYRTNNGHWSVWLLNYPVVNHPNGTFGCNCPIDMQPRSSVI